MDLRVWILDDFDATTARLRAQVLDIVPAERRREQPGGGNSIVWGSFHVARHIDAALTVVTGAKPEFGGWESDFDEPASRGGAGLEEAEQPWATGLDPVVVDAYLGAVLANGRRFLSDLRPDDLDRAPDVEDGLSAAGVPGEQFGWLYRMWQGQPVAFFVRWPIIGHVGNHIGEMVATRNRMGLSPF
jgi:hypothetical protein